MTSLILTFWNLSVAYPSLYDLYVVLVIFRAKHGNPPKSNRIRYYSEANAEYFAANTGDEFIFWSPPNSTPIEGT